MLKSVHSGDSRPSFDEFVHRCKHPKFDQRSKVKRLARCFFVRRLLVRPGEPSFRLVNWYGLAVELRVRVPNGIGRFGRGVEGARWCWPWQWYRLYYAARFPATSRGPSSAETGLSLAELLALMPDAGTTPIGGLHHSEQQQDGDIEGKPCRIINADVLRASGLVVRIDSSVPSGEVWAERGGKVVMKILGLRMQP